MREQIEIAVKWWGEQLRTRTKQDNGDLMTSVFMSALSGDGEDLTKVELFENKLRELLPKRLLKCWHVDEPMRGSAIRCLECDYGPDHVLREAAQFAGILPDCPPFPMKTVMWINPDSVSVSHGYGAKPVVLWPNRKDDARR